MLRGLGPKFRSVSLLSLESTPFSYPFYELSVPDTHVSLPPIVPYRQRKDPFHVSHGPSVPFSFGPPGARLPRAFKVSLRRGRLEALT